jgi:hypothetical protein
MTAPDGPDTIRLVRVTHEELRDALALYRELAAMNYRDCPRIVRE